uniref:Basal body orientation factor 1 n=1 Tax=Fundulus heteroclitus TaxID=8078 RepID=A0A3Q2UK22_FUNHE
FCHRKGKKSSKHEPKSEKEPDLETARANAALWELKLKTTEQDLSDYRGAHHDMARMNEQLTNQLSRSERDSVDMTGYWQREVEDREEKLVHGLKKCAAEVQHAYNECSKPSDWHWTCSAFFSLEQDMLESTVKKNSTKMETKEKKLSEATAKVASLERALEEISRRLEQQEEKEKRNLVTIQASQVELDKLQKLLAMKDKEMQRVKQLARTIVDKRKEAEEFFHEALDHVRQEIVASRLQYKKEALQDYQQKFREATAGIMRFPPICTLNKSPNSTSYLYADSPSTEVQMSQLTWEQKEKVIPPQVAYTFTQHLPTQLTYIESLTFVNSQHLSVYECTL